MALLFGYPGVPGGRGFLTSADPGADILEHVEACGDPVSCDRGGKVAGTDRSRVLQKASPHRPSRTRVLENAAPDTPARKDGKAHVHAGARLPIFAYSAKESPTSDPTEPPLAICPDANFGVLHLLGFGRKTPARRLERASASLAFSQHRPSNHVAGCKNPPRRQPLAG